MELTANKIQVPLKTKIAAIIAAVMGLFYLFVFLMGVFFDSDSSFIESSMFFVSRIFGYGVVCFCLLIKKRIGYYIGLLMFSWVSLFFLIEIIGRNISTDILFFLFNFAALAFLLIDRKNYFAAVKKGENKMRG